MADPLDVLRGPDGPGDPDPQFAAGLRARLERALAAPEGVDVSSTALEIEPTTATAQPSLPPLTNALTPYLTVADGRGAIAWYAEVFGALVAEPPYEMPDGRIGHAELRLGGARLYLADEFPDLNLGAPGGVTSVTLHLAVADVDAVVTAARAAGAAVEREPADYPYGRNGVVRDPFGHRWLLDQARAPSGFAEGEGDAGYLSLWVRDLDRAEAFYAHVLGWTFAERSPFARTVSGSMSRAVVALDAPNAEFWPDPRPGAFISRAVADIDAAVARVRAAGGRASDPQDTPYGRSADCVDDQGLPFSLHERGPGEPRPAVNGERHGDVAYVTVLTPDSARFRAFSEAVFGWTFSSGRVADGWNVDGPAPMTGVAGGQAHPELVPMYRVDDLAAAVQRVREAGGTATDPEPQPYGQWSQCTDDQGLPFHLGQL